MATTVAIRAATAEDADDILRWRNDPTTRQMSRNTGAISRDDHLAWYDAALRDPARLLLIGCVDGVSIGMVRFDRLSAGRWEVSVNLDPAQRGKGLSRPLLAGALKSIEAGRPDTIVAEIKPINTVSRRLFESLDFRRVASDGAMDRFELVQGRSS